MKCGLIVLLVLAGLSYFPVETFLIGLAVFIVAIVKNAQKYKRSDRRALRDKTISELERWDAYFEKSVAKHGDYERAAKSADFLTRIKRK